MTKRFTFYLRLFLILSFLIFAKSAKAVIVEAGTQLPANCPLLAAELKKYPTAFVKSFTSFRPSTAFAPKGVIDDYDTFQAMSTALSGKVFTQRQIVFFPAGTYYINRFIRSGANTNKDVTFRNSQNFSIIGCNARIEVKGDFNLPNDWSKPGRTGTIWYTLSKQVIPFIFEFCSRFKLAGFDINGNVNKMTRPQAAGMIPAETRSHGIMTAAASQYELIDLRVHHFASDGLYLGSNKKADTAVTIDKLDSYSNARQGMSIIQARSVLVKNSKFRRTGKTDGVYRGHSPQAGVDIEPNFVPANGASVMTGNIIFENCVFADNFGSQFVSGGFGDTVDGVTIRKSEITAYPGNSNLVVILPVKNGVIEDSAIDTGAGAIYPTWAGHGAANVNTIVRRNRIRSTGPGLLVTVAGSKVVVENNTFISAHNPAQNVYFPYIQNGVSRFTGNTINYSTRFFGTRRIVSLMQNIPLINNNIITTDRRDVDYWIGSTGSKSFLNNRLTGRVIFYK